MEAPSLSKKSSGDLKKVYLMRRVVLIAAIIIVALIIAFSVFFMVEKPATKPTQEQKPMDILPPPIYEREPQLPIVLNDTANETINETIEPTIEACEMEVPMSTLQYLGCLEPNDELDIFDAQGIRLTDRNIRKLIEKIENTCDTDNADGVVDRDCIVKTAVEKSESSWVCEWSCLEDLASCETYKMHLAVAILRKYVPPTDAFVVRTDDFEFFLIYKDSEGEWMQPQYTYISNPDVEAIYNDIYHAGPITEVVFPEITTVEPGDDFCFDVYAPRTCTCTVEVDSFTVGDCPQIPADLRGICDKPVTEVFLPGGKTSRVCFTIDEDAEEEFYTYKFSLTGGEEYVPAGNAFIKEKKWDCCVNATFEGFLSIE